MRQDMNQDFVKVEIVETLCEEMFDRVREGVCNDIWDEIMDETWGDVERLILEHATLPVSDKLKSMRD